MPSKYQYTLLVLLQINFLKADPIIQLPNGLINGQESTTLENKTYYAFRGIPYAAPPIGDLRFKPPQPAVNWDDTRDATKMTTTCFQTGNNNEHASEDCLFINVYTPELPSEDNNVSLPVMLFIHGGGFVDGNGMDYVSDPFVNNDVILATINYRLGIFGFISTQDEVIPGNNGLKDQQFAIQWTHDNIHLFGGDRDRVTIFGQSAGSASVGYQLLNQKNNGLFQAAILDSGSFLSPWAFQRQSKQIAFTTASLLNSTFEDSNDSTALLEFLLTVNAKDLDDAAAKYHNLNYGPQTVELSQGFFWAPVVEVKNPDAFLTRKMYGLLKAGNVLQVPVLMGITSEESLGLYQDPDAFFSNMTDYNDNLGWLVPNDMQITNDTQRTEIGKAIRDLYTNGLPLENYLGNCVRYESDNSFTRSIIKHAELFSKFGETYFYVFSYDGELAHGPGIYYEGAEKVGHGEELAYMFCSGSGCDDRIYLQEDRITRRRVVKLWTNFAKFKNPTPEPSELLQNVTWPVVSTDGGDFLYLDINEDLVVKNHPKQETYEGWIKLYDSLNFDDFDTY